MRDRSALYLGLLLVLFGGVFLLAGAVSEWLRLWGIELGMARLWPLIVVAVGLAFWLPIVVWWDRRQAVAGLAMPGTIVLINGLMLLYQSLSGDWGSWAYLWTMEPIAVAMGLLALYALGIRSQGVLLAASIVGTTGLVLFMAFSAIFGGILRLAAPAALILVGILFILGAARTRAARPWPEE